MSAVPGSAPIKGAPGPLKKVPKWAWVASGGVIVGVAVMRWRSNSGSKVPTGQDTATADTGLTSQSFPAAGVVPAAAGDAGYSGGNGSGTSVDIPALMDSLGNFLAVNTPVDHTADVVTAVLAGLPGYAGGGGAPQSGAAAAAPAPQNQAPTPPAPEPEPAAPAAPVVTSQTPQPQQLFTHTENNGKHGAARRVWCMCGNHKVADGACWAEGHACT